MNWRRHVSCRDSLDDIRRASSRADAPQRPNILYIMSDDHAAHALSCNGSKINQTPNLDRIASAGMRFTNCFCTDSLCGPSRAVLLTGKYNHLNGFRDNGPKTTFDGSQQTFPKLLQKAGYQTAIVGKWHLNSDPTGFDYWSILPGQGRYHDPQFITMGKKSVEKGYVTDIITDKALDFMKNRDTSKPFCLLYHHKAPHRSWEPDEKHAHMYDDVEIPTPFTFDDDYSHRTSAAHEQEMQIDKYLNRQDLKMDPPPGLTGEALQEVEVRAASSRTIYASSRPSTTTSAACSITSNKAAWRKTRSSSTHPTTASSSAITAGSTSASCTRNRCMCRCLSAGQAASSPAW